LMYATGLGTPVNKSVARGWFQKAASHGFRPAQQALTQIG
jgi:TPR repeat protein